MFQNKKNPFHDQQILDRINIFFAVLLFRQSTTFNKCSESGKFTDLNKKSLENIPVVFIHFVRTKKKENKNLFI